MRESNLRLSLKDAEWKALKAQINPHFLFNALNSINALITSDPQKARLMLVQLSEMLRRVLAENPSQTISLEQELAFLHQYIDLEKIRLQDRLDYQENVDQGLLDHLIPVMLLQPLVENAIKHGISKSVRGGWIKLTLQKENANISGVIENSIPQDISNNSNNDENTATGLANLQQRLDLLYGNRSQFSTMISENREKFRVQFTLPLQKEGTA